MKPGDVRLANPWIGCGACAACQRGEENLCVKPQFLGVFAQGGYASHLLVPHARHLFDVEQVWVVLAGEPTVAGEATEVHPSWTRADWVVPGPWPEAVKQLHSDLWKPALA